MTKKIKNIFISISKHKILISAILIFVIIVSILSVISYEKERKENLFAAYATIDDTEISKLEYMYHYQNYKSEFLSTYASYIATLEIPEGETLEQQIQDEEEQTTWAEFFANHAFQQLLEVNFLYELAVENNYVLQTLEEDIEYELENLRQTAIDKNIKYSQYLSETFINGTKEEDLKDIIKKKIISEYYETEYKNTLEISDKEIEEYYNDNKNDYDNVDFRIFTFSVYEEYLKIINELSSSATANGTNYEIKEDMTAEEIVQTEEYIKAKENILKKANDFYNQVYNEDTFKKLCIEYSSTDKLKELYEKQDYSLKEEIGYSETTDSLKEWLFDDSKTEKTTAILYDEDNFNYHIVYFIKRYRNETDFVTVKNIFIPYESTDLTTFIPTEKDKENTKNKVDNIIQEWESTKKSSTDFDNLAKKYTKDTEKITYSNLTQEELPQIFAEWSYNKERKSGDYIVLDDNNGYYIVYFDKTSEDILDYQIKKDLIEERFESLMKEMFYTHDFEIIYNK